MSDDPHRITCPICQRTSWHHQDVEEGYCGFCHDWTAADAPLSDLEKWLARRTVGYDPTYEHGFYWRGQGYDEAGGR